MTPPQPLHVLVAGGGAAATEVALVLREHVGADVRLTLVAPEPDTSLRALPTAEPFSAPRRRRPLRGLARDLDAELHDARIAAVDAGRHEVHLGDGRTLGYDALVLATGARPRAVLDGALTLFGHVDACAVDRLLLAVEQGLARSLAFVVPPGLTWPLALYELALQTAEEARVRGLDVALRLLTPEPAPLHRFGATAQSTVERLLDDAGIAFSGSAAVFEGLDGRAHVDRIGAFLPEERVVALPVLEGPALVGVPATADGFIPIDHCGAVPGLPDVFAAGDATAFPIKHVDLACQQADAIADVLAVRAGAVTAPREWRPQVREHLLAGFDGAVPLEQLGNGAVESHGLQVAMSSDGERRRGRRRRNGRRRPPEPGFSAFGR